MTTDFWKGIITGVATSLLLFGVILFFVISNKKEKEIIKYVQIQQEIESLREDYGNRDPVEFLDVPGVRGAADNSFADFERRRDEAVQRFRSGQSSGAGRAD